MRNTIFKVGTAFTIGLMSATAPQQAGAQSSNPGTNANGGTNVSIFDQPPSNPSNFDFDYGVPMSPALSLAGLSADKVPTASSLKSFVLSLPSVLETGSSGKSGALDIAPATLLLSPEQLNVDSYQSYSPEMRDLIRTHFGLAISAGSDGDGNLSKAQNSKLAFSLSTSLLDNNDPLALGYAGWDAQQACFLEQGNLEAAKQYESTQPVLAQREQLYKTEEEVNSAANIEPDHHSYEKAVKDAANALNTTDTSAVPSTPQEKVAVLNNWMGKLHAAEKSADLSAARQVTVAAQTLGIAKIFDDCGKDGAVAASYSPALDVGVGAVWTGEDGDAQDFKDGSATAWTGFRFPFDVVFGGDPAGKDDGQAGTKVIDPTGYWIVGGSARYAYETEVSTGNKAMPQVQANVADLWVGLERYGLIWSRQAKFDAQYGYLDQSAVEAADSKYTESGSRWLVSGSFELLTEQGVWLEASYGNAEGTTTKLDDKTFMLSLNFGPPKASSIFGISNSDSSGGNGSKSSGAQSPGATPDAN